MRSEERDRPAWQLPPGVSRGTWDYVQSAPIATEYDTFHAGHPLLEFDRSLVLEVARRIAKERGAGVDRLVALDLGCGTGRTMLPLAEEGWRVLGVDLSESMLREEIGRAHV